jgi:hypothetical protein
MKLPEDGPKYGPKHTEVIKQNQCIQLDLYFYCCVDGLSITKYIGNQEQLSNMWQKTLQGLDTNNMRDTWRISKSLTNTNPNIRPVTVNRKTATTIQEKLNVFADNLRTNFHYKFGC